jgi:serine/threonine protein kinase
MPDLREALSRNKIIVRAIPWCYSCNMLRISFFSFILIASCAQGMWFRNFCHPVLTALVRFRQPDNLLKKINAEEIYKKAIKKKQENKQVALERNSDYKNFPKVGGFIKVKNRDYKIKAVLGSGHEGVVYLVDTPKGPRAIKKFRKQDYDSNVGVAVASYVSRLHSFELPTPKVYQVDLKEGTVMMQFIDGLHLHEIINEGSKEYGLSQEQVEAIWKKFIRTI